MSDKTNYDPKLKIVMEKITKILEASDISGFVVLVSETHSEFRYHPHATWNALQWEKRGSGEGIRVNATEKEFGKEGRNRRIEGAVHVLGSLRELCAVGFDFARTTLAQVTAFVEVTENPGPITPHDPEKHGVN